MVVFENIKAWRKNKTTIVITHDLSQIVPEDFVYVMSNGYLVEQGFRSDLVKCVPIVGQDTGVFAAMAAEQAVEPLAPKMEDWRDRPESEELLEGELDFTAVSGRASRASWISPAPSFAVGRDSAAYFDILDEYSRRRGSSVDVDNQGSKRLSKAQKRLTWTQAELESGKRDSRSNVPHLARPGSRTSYVPRSSTYGASTQSLAVPTRPASRVSRQPSRDSYLLAPPSDTYNMVARTVSRYSEKEVDYPAKTLSQNLDDEIRHDLEIVTHSSPYEAAPPKLRGIVSLLWYWLPTLPSKPLLVFGLLGAVLHGVATPVWSFFLAKLMTIVGAGGTDPALTKWGLVLLALSAAQGIVYWVQDWSLFRLSATWTGQIRGKAYEKVLKQDKAWFDVSANSPASLVQILIKDADDMRTVVSTIIGKIVVFIAMVGLGVGWALVVDWRLTLVGVALAPVFAGIMVLQEGLVGKAEVANKAKREDVAKVFYEVSRDPKKIGVVLTLQSVANVRGIRAMALDGTFRKEFMRDAVAAKATGTRTGWFVAIGLAASAALPLFAQALLNWVGAQFMIKGYISYPEMLQVYNLVLFSLTFGSAMLDFSESCFI